MNTIVRTEEELKAEFAKRLEECGYKVDKVIMDEDHLVAKCQSKKGQNVVLGIPAQMLNN